MTDTFDVPFIEAEPFTPGADIARTLAHPDDVLDHPALTTQEKRAILASWSSDARAVEGVPTLRRLDNGAEVAIDDILRALRKLDAADGSGTPSRWSVTFPRRFRWPRKGPRHRARDDDDDPPPGPAVAASAPLKPTFVAAYGARQSWIAPRVARARGSGRLGTERSSVATSV